VASLMSNLAKIEKQGIYEAYRERYRYGDLHGTIKYI